MSAMDTTSPVAPERAHLRLGFVALSDAAPLIVAQHLNLGARHGLTLELSRQPSWAAVRDKLLSGELDAAHALYGLVCGLQLGIGGPQADMAALMVLNRNGQAISLSRGLADAYRASGSVRDAFATLGRKPLLAQTFPTGTHAMWLNHWLASHGVDPLRDVRSVVIPPPEIVAALASGELDGFCAGEPWHAVAEACNAGRTVAVTSEIWPDHPEKVLAARRDFVALYPATARALIRTLVDACAWLDSATHRREAAGWLASPDALGVPARLIAPRLLGDYGSGPFAVPPLPIRFHDGGTVNRPDPREGEWFLSQYRRWGMLDGSHDDAAIARAIAQTALYDAAVAESGAPGPSRA